MKVSLHWLHRRHTRFPLDGGGSQPGDNHDDSYDHDDDGYDDNSDDHDDDNDGDDGDDVGDDDLHWKRQ